MYQLNWGLALANNGSYQVIDTIISPGIRDEWSEPRFESFTFLVAPAEYVDRNLGLLDSNNYKRKRSYYINNRSYRVKEVILNYFGLKKPAPTWSENYSRPKKEWGDFFYR
tara:strand:- start:4985 stop:5317 length:333 start_codon:yes stop_codon:yes gene_type:complete